MDPEIEDHYKDLLDQWKKDEDNVKDQLNEIMTKLDALKEANDPPKMTVKCDEDVTPQETMTHRTVMCKEKYHENEAVVFYCQKCEVCICQKCITLNHNRHSLMGLPEAAEKKKMEMTKGFMRAKEKLATLEKKIRQQVDLMKKSEEQISAAEKMMSEAVEEIIRVAREHETVVKKELTVMKEAQQNNYETKMESFQLLATQLRTSIEYGECVVQRDVAAEILEEGHTVFVCCKELLNTEEINIYRPQYVTYNIAKETINDARHIIPGQVVAWQTEDPLQSVAEEEGLKEAELGAETKFTITSRDSEGNQFYDQGSQVTVKICSPTCENYETNIKNSKDGIYTVSFKPNSVGLHEIAIEVNGKPLTVGPWNIQVVPHKYKALLSFGSDGTGRGEFDGPGGIAVSERTGNIAVADEDNKRVHLFDCGLKYLRTIGNKWISKRISVPESVAFTASDDVIIIHCDILESRKMSIFSQRGMFIRHISDCLNEPRGVSVTNDGHMVVCDQVDDKIKVLSPDGRELLQSFGAPYCNATPLFAVYHQDTFFACFHDICCIKVFNKDGVFLHDIGSEGSGDGQFDKPLGLAIDKFNNLIVCDRGNNRLQVFSLDGKFVNSFGLESNLRCPLSVAVTENGRVLVSDYSSDCIYVFQ